MPARQLSPTEILWEVDGDGGLESLGGFPGKGSAKRAPPRPQPIPQLPPNPAKPKAAAPLAHSQSHAPVHAQPPASVDLVDGALVVAYRFYCRVQTPGSQLGRAPLGFDEVAECNASLSFLGLLSLLRDFDVVPQLLLPEVMPPWKLARLRAQAQARKWQ